LLIGVNVRDVKRLRDRSGPYSLFSVRTVSPHLSMSSTRELFTPCLCSGTRAPVSMRKILDGGIPVERRYSWTLCARLTARSRRSLSRTSMCPLMSFSISSGVKDNGMPIAFFGFGNSSVLYAFFR